MEWHLAQDVLDQMAAFARLYPDLAIHVADESRGNPVFTLAFFRQDCPEKCVSLEEWKEGFVDRLPLNEGVAWNPSGIVFSDAIIARLRDLHDTAVYRGLLNERKGVKYLSTQFCFEDGNFEPCYQAGLIQRPVSNRRTMRPAKKARATKY